MMNQLVDRKQLVVGKCKPRATHHRRYQGPVFGETGDTNPKTGDMALPNDGSRRPGPVRRHCLQKKALAFKVNRGQGRKGGRGKGEGRQGKEA
jgi:hypothetical protein